MSRFIAATLVVLISVVNLQSQAIAEVGAGIVFSQDEIRIINTWYRDHGSTANRGGGKKKLKGLPPGIAKNLARGKPLPPGIAKRHLPDGLRYALPTPPAGYERIIVDGKVLLVEIATRVIHDILVDAVLH